MYGKNVLKDLESKEVEFELAKKFLLKLKKEFSGGDERSVKVAELKKVEQKGRTMEKLI